MVVVNMLCLLLCNIRVANSSLWDSFRLIDEEAGLIQVLQDYIDMENGWLDKVKIYQETLIEHAKVYPSKEEFASNPLAIYKGVKHLTIDLKDIKKNMIKNSYNDAVIKTIQEVNPLISDNHRLYHEIRSLTSLQRAYNLTVEDMMKGRLAPSSQFVTPALTVQDCFLIGKISAEYNDYETTADWLKACQKMFDNETRDEADLILVLSYLYLGNKWQCLYLTYQIFYDSPRQRSLLDLHVKLGYELNHWLYSGSYSQWDSCNTCAGDYEQEISSRNMKCRYNHHNTPFLTIAPLKEELILLNPRVTVFREVLYDSEIEHLIMDAYDKLTPGRLSTTRGRVLNVQFRTADSMFLELIQTGPRYEQLRNRLMDMSLLSLHPADKMQIIYYVPGGFIRVHNDFLRSGVEMVEVYGQRQSQALFYLNDVTLGGETVFPRSRVRVKPVKGSILWWPNIKADGSEQTMSEHVSCPTVYGEKIVCVQWFRTKGQDHYITPPEDKPIEETNPFDQIKMAQKKRV